MIDEMCDRLETTTRTQKTMKRLIPLVLAISVPALTWAQTTASDSLAREEQKMLCNEARSLYDSYEDQGDYHEAYIQWGKACEICPEEYIESVYSAGIRLLEEEHDAADKAKDEARMTACSDSIFMLYDRRLALHAEEGRANAVLRSLGCGDLIGDGFTLVLHANFLCTNNNLSKTEGYGAILTFFHCLKRSRFTSGPHGG